jgi:3-hydroxy-9,10-secoandrosta-1,3,5(10)-triene-9,17-dione monooxygenase reductase component
VKQASGTWPMIQEAASFCVNVLGEQQEEVSRRFASSELDRFRRFDGLAWEATPSGAPRLVDALAWLDCRIEAVHPAGDHDICVGRVEALGVNGEGGPLVFYRGGYGRFAP